MTACPIPSSSWARRAATSPTSPGGSPCARRWRPHSELDLSRWHEFSPQLHYQPVVYDELETYHALARRLEALEQLHGTGGNRVFNLALPPTLYATVAGMIGQAHMSHENGDGHWRRLVVEKPFGRDLASARKLDQAIGSSFQEHQVFRIDHYLAKETVQNVLMLRFANAIFEPIWNRNYIDHVTIIATESLGVEHRAGYYEQAGVLRDMFQNHMMQLLALSAMEPPSRYGADRVRDEKTKTFRAVRPFGDRGMDEYLVLGQYDAGPHQGPTGGGLPRRARGGPGLAHAYLRHDEGDDRQLALAGACPSIWSRASALAKKITRVIIQFKEVPHSFMREVLGEHITANQLVLSIQPEESINLTIQTKNPGAKICLRSVEMVYDYHQEYKGPLLEAYEKALLDCMLGDQMLFWRQDGLEITWALLDPVLQACETCMDRAGRLHPYPAGGWGPSSHSGPHAQLAKRGDVTCNLKLYSDPEALARGVADDLVAEARRAIDQRGRFCLALSGGFTPLGAYRVLSERFEAEEFPWRQAHFFWSDERCVGADDPANNYGAARRAMLRPRKVPAENIHRIRGEAALGGGGRP